MLECSGTDNNSGGATFDHHGDNDLDKPVTCKDAKGNGWELKTGTEGDQHLVAINPNGSGTRFGTVYIRIHGKEGEL